MAAMLYNYAVYKGLDVTSVATLAAFSDADSVSTWAKVAIEWTVSSNLINGYPDGTLKPQGTATRAEVAVIFERFFENILE